MVDFYIDFEGDKAVRLTNRSAGELYNAIQQELPAGAREIRAIVGKAMRGPKSGRLYRHGTRRLRASAEGETVGRVTGNLFRGLKVERRGDKVLVRSTAPHTHLVTQKHGRVIFENAIAGKEEHIGLTVLERALKRVNQ